nr:MAG TPA: hypothetical protein [Caudoviricetes sp.]
MLMVISARIWQRLSACQFQTFQPSGMAEVSSL